MEKINYIDWEGFKNNLTAIIESEGNISANDLKDLFDDYACELKPNKTLLLNKKPDNSKIAII